MYRFLLIICFAISFQAIAQPKKVIYRISITKMDGKIKPGYLRSVSDSTLTISAKHNKLTPEQVLAYSEISVIKIRKHRAILNGWLLGTAGGATLGAIIGRATYQEPECSGFICVDFGPGFQTLGGGIIGGLAGGVIGISVGSKSKKIKLSGDKKAFTDAQAELKNLIVQ
jgi:hypothetical protein